MSDEALIASLQVDNADLRAEVERLEREASENLDEAVKNATWFNEAELKLERQSPVVEAARKVALDQSQRIAQVYARPCARERGPIRRCGCARPPGEGGRR